VCSTWRFNLPTSSPSRISRASSEWPTSSNASVESWPPTSRRTSSPPLSVNVSGFFHVCDRGALVLSKVGVVCIKGRVPGMLLRARKRRHVRVLIDEARGVVDLVVYNNVEVLLGVVFRDIGVGEFLVGRHCELCGRYARFGR
jgi:hypothetical protein